jgi:hypothetical protein
MAYAAGGHESDGEMSDTAISARARDEADDAERLTGDDAREWVGYRVDAPEGHLGVVQEVRFAGVPPRPLVLLVRALDRLYLLPARRIARVLPAQRRVLLWPDSGLTARRR